MACSDCAGSGKVRTRIVDLGGAEVGKGGVRGCEECKKKGVVACTDCHKGLVKCKKCRGKKKVRESCVGVLYCRCKGTIPHELWENMGDFLVNKRQLTLARKFYERAQYVREKFLKSPSKRVRQLMAPLTERLEGKLAALRKRLSMDQ